VAVLCFNWLLREILNIRVSMEAMVISEKTAQFSRNEQPKQFVAIDGTGGSDESLAAGELHGRLEEMMSTLLLAEFLSSGITRSQSDKAVQARSARNRTKLPIVE
jgi:hypothetical protein